MNESLLSQFNTTTVGMNNKNNVISAMMNLTEFDRLPCVDGAAEK
jgi:hypothetical protein